MNPSQVYACGTSHGFSTTDGNAFAQSWLTTAGFDSIPPLPAAPFANIVAACVWISENFTGVNPCQTG